MTGIVIIAVTILVLVWDLYLYFDKTEGNTISQTVVKWSGKHPFVPFALGVLMGHFFA